MWGRKSLNDRRHYLSHEFEPDFDYELWMNTLQGGNIEGAKRLKLQLLIKYADYPDVKKRFEALINKPFAVQNLGALDPLFDLSFEDGLRRWS